jgi:hypothetical protein
MAVTRDERLARRRAIEALRSGVPNRDAVAILGCNQPRAEEAFSALLAGAAEAGGPAGGALGMLVSGDFGAGKSHLLAHLERRALARGFVCSRVAISKETPLYDLGKVFRSAIENGRMPDRRGRLIEELGLVTDWRSSASANFLQWAESAASSGVLSRMFPASLLVYERLNDIELNGRIESFWAGDRLKVSEIKSGLASIGQKQSGSFRAPRAAELPPQRLRFAIELIKCAGYKGWVVLLDELELIGSYSILQRGRSYAELARWMGRSVESYPGLVAAGTVTDDFASAVISPDGGKKDRDHVGPRLAKSRYAGIAALAKGGMRLLERSCVPLNPPSEDDVNDTIDKLRKIYSEAYGWDAPRLAGRTGGAGVQTRMRYKVRAAINEWDLLRLYPGSAPDTVVDEFHATYEEDADLERKSGDVAEAPGRGPLRLLRELRSRARG